MPFLRRHLDKPLGHLVKGDLAATAGLWRQLKPRFITLYLASSCLYFTYVPSCWQTIFWLMPPRFLPAALLRKDRLYFFLVIAKDENYQVTPAMT